MATKKKTGAPIASLVPSPAAPAAVPSFAEFPELVDMLFGELVTERDELSDSIKHAETRKKEIDEELQAGLTLVEQKTVQVNEFQLIMCNGRTAAKLDPKLLARAGVDADTIQQCTVPGREYTYMQVKKGEKDE